MAKSVLSQKVPFEQVAMLILFALPSIIAQSAPFASLVGTLMTVGRLTSDNEILVMLSSGLSYKTVFIPAVVMGIFISLMSFFTNDVLLPAGTVQFNKLWRKILAATPAVELNANSVKRFKDTVIVTGGVTDNVINDILILDRTQDGERRVIMASSAELKDGGKDGIGLFLSDAFIQSSKEVVREDYDYASTDLLQYWVSNEDIVQAAVSISPREMSSRDVGRAVLSKRETLETRGDAVRNRIAGQGLSLERILRAGPDSDSWNKRASVVSLYNREIATLAEIYKDRSLAIYVVELYRKFAVPFGAFCFVFLAVSLGLMAKKSGQTVGFIFGILIAVLYWSMLFMGHSMALRVGTSPFISVWLPNILCLAAGIILVVIRVVKVKR
jgi:lipopolysaccharide export system permease protein